MNFSNGNTFPGFGKRIHWQIATLAGVLALALSAGALAGVFERGASPAMPTVVRPADPPAISAPIAPAAGGPSQAVYFLVGSPGEAAALASAISTDAAEYGLSEQTANLSIVTLETPAQEAQFATTLSLAAAELTAEGIGVQVVDLRETGLPSIALDSSAGETAGTIVYVVGSQAQRIALEQQFHEASAHQVDNTNRSVLVIEGPDADGLYNTLAGEQMAAGTFEVVDLR